MARIDRVLVGVVTSGGTMSVALVVVAAILLVFTEVAVATSSVFCQNKTTREKRSELLRRLKIHTHSYGTTREINDDVTCVELFDGRIYEKGLNNT